MNYFGYFHYLPAFTQRASGVLGTVIFFQLLTLESSESGIYVSYHQPLLTRVPSETSAKESARSILKDTFSTRRDI